MTIDRTKNPSSYMAPANLHARDWTPGRWLQFDPFNGWGLPAAPGVYVYFMDGAALANSQRTPWGIVGPAVLITGKLKVSRRYGDWAMQELRLIRALSPRFNLHHKRKAAANG